jgi:hypothetical protein
LNLNFHYYQSFWIKNNFQNLKIYLSGQKFLPLIKFHHYLWNFINIFKNFFRLYIKYLFIFIIFSHKFNLLNRCFINFINSKIQRNFIYLGYFYRFIIDSFYYFFNHNYIKSSLLKIYCFKICTLFIFMKMIYFKDFFIPSLVFIYYLSNLFKLFP